MNVEFAGAGWVLPLVFALQALSAVLIVIRLVCAGRAPPTAWWPSTR
jgi:multicomponent Na+:H+ antiporter subunit F